MSGKEQGRVVVGKSGATSTNKVIWEGKWTGRVGRCEDKPKGLESPGSLPSPGSAMTCPSRNTEPGGSRSDQPGLCAQGSVTVQWCRSQPISCMAGGKGRGARSTPAAPKMEGSSWKKILGQVRPWGRLWPGLWLGERDCTGLALRMGLGRAGGSNSGLSRALGF